jgi:toxin YoeB
MPKAWVDYLYWQEHDKKILKRINELLKDINRTPFAGIGQPEPLKHKLSGLWSRRIDGTHRITYEVSDTQILIISCRYHYHDK